MQEVYPIIVSMLPFQNTVMISIIYDGQIVTEDDDEDFIELRQFMERYDRKAYLTQDQRDNHPLKFIDEVVHIVDFEPTLHSLQNYLSEKLSSNFSVEVDNLIRN